MAGILRGLHCSRSALKPVSDEVSSAERIISDLERYQGSRGGRLWPAIVPFRQWAGEEHSGLSFSREQALAVLSLLCRGHVQLTQAVISRYGNGLSTLLWGAPFKRVLSVAQESPSVPSLLDGDKFKLAIGSLDRTVFVYKLLAELETINLLVLEESRYERVISPYYLFRQKMSHPGVVVFIGTKREGVQRFLTDLRSGDIDGYAHEVSDVESESGQGLAYEVVKGTRNSRAVESVA